MNSILIKFDSSLNFLQEKLTQLGKWLKKVFLHPNEGMKTFYALMFVANLCYIYTWINHSFTVPLSGDYTLQEMTFLFNGYDDWHTFFRTGQFPTWDRSVFLGVDNVAANSFYYLFDPFFLVLLIFPRSWLLVLQGLEFIPKMVLAAMFFYWYLGSFNFSPKARRLGALVFAFNGFSFSYLWFHFIDSVAFLPLVFLGIERVIKKRDPRILLVGWLLNAMASYFFFVVFMIGGFFYAIFRFFQTMKERSFDENWAVIGMGFFSFLIGIFLSAFVLLPGMSMALNMPRVSSDGGYLQNILHAETLSDKIHALFTWENQQTRVTPLLNFLFMTDDCYSANLLNVYWYDNFSSSLYVTTPMLLLFFVSLIDSFKEKKIGHLIAVFLMAFVILTPIGFYLFSGFTVGYARYFILPISWMIVFDLEAYEKRREIPERYLDLSLMATLILDVVSCVLMIYIVKNNPSSFPSSTAWDSKMLLIPLSVIWVIVCYVVMRILFHKKVFSKAVFGLSALDIIVMANATIYFQGTNNISTMAGGPRNIKEETRIVSAIKEGEGGEDYYRIYNTTADRNNINISLREGYTGLGSFHSVYAFGAQNFINRSRIPYTYQNWSMGIHNRRYNLETFLGTKYYLVPRIQENYGPYQMPRTYPGDSLASDYDIPYGYKNILSLSEEEKKKLGVSYSQEFLDFLASDQCDKSVYINTDFVDFAFPFDNVINEEWLATGFNKSKEGEDEPVYNAYEDINEYPLLRYAIVDNETYDSFLKTRKYSTGSVVINGKTVDLSNQSVSTAGSNFCNELTSFRKYQEGSGEPIEFYSPNQTINRMKITVYAANWPATESVPSGEYAACTIDNPYDSSCLSDYRSTHPFEYMNGIRPADTQYDFSTKRKPDGTEFKENGVLYNSKLVIDLVDKDGNPSPIAPNATPDDPSSGVYISIFDQDNITWRLFDKDNKIISFGKHSYSAYKQAHGYYADRPVYRIVGVLQEGSKDNPIRLRTPYLYVQQNKDYQSAIDNLKKEPIEFVSRSDGDIVFNTNYSSNKFVVLNYPKQNGWKLYEVDKDGKETEVKQYSAQGGFIGFEAAKGEKQYHLKYKSPWFLEGAVITGLGFFITLICMICFTQRDRRLYQNLEFNSLEYTIEQKKKKEAFAYDCYEERRD